jgi:hypothetical protein
MSFLLTPLKDLYVRTRGFHTDRKLIVFESDDWGSIRMPSKSVFEQLKTFGDDPERDGFLSNDCLESEADILSLYEVLSSVTDFKGRFPIFTMNFAMANPNFDKIDLKNGIYEYEPFYNTYNKYYGENQILEIVLNGYRNRLILPQLHCREHLNVGRWMHDLMSGKSDTLTAFENKMIGIGCSFDNTNRFGYMDAFNTDFSSDEDLAKILDNAVEIFYDTFGYKSQTFVASCFVWNDKLENCLRNNGIRYIQSAAWQNKAIGKNGTYQLKRTLHYTGERNNINQMYSVRNCSFEPAYNQDSELCVKNCLNDVSKAFKSKSPAIINSHRFNYISSINHKNRENNLRGLKTLLDSLLDKYEDVEFISSAELFALMDRDKK